MKTMCATFELETRSNHNVFLDLADRIHNKYEQKINNL